MIFLPLLRPMGLRSRSMPGGKLSVNSLPDSHPDTHEGASQVQWPQILSQIMCLSQVRSSLAPPFRLATNMLDRYYLGGTTPM